MPRLFTAIDIPEDIKQYLSLLKTGLPGARWISPENYHITLSFFGDIEQYIADDIELALENIEFENFKIRIMGLGSFGGDKPRSIWAKVEANKQLQDLQKSNEAAARQVGISPEARKYVPHITLARLKRTSPFDVAKFLENFSDYKSEWLEIQSFVLLSSRSSKGGGPYVIEAEYPSSTTYLN